MTLKSVPCLVLALAIGMEDIMMLDCEELEFVD